MTRAFVAVKLPWEALTAIDALTDGLEIRGARKTTISQWHITLHFLGDADLYAVASALENFDVPGGSIRLGGAGAFPNARRGRVLWVGLVKGADVLARLAGGVARRLAPIGNEPDERPFRAHVTLARCASPADLRGPIAALGSAPVGDAWDVGELTLYESRLGEDGPRYVEQATIALPR